MILGKRSEFEFPIDLRECIKERPLTPHGSLKHATNITLSLAIGTTEETAD